MSLDPQRLENAYQAALAAILSERSNGGYWVGELSTSALSTATAVMALALVQKHKGGDAFNDLIAGGIQWLVDHQNDDGGWGDTVKSISNISTTMLCRAAFHLTGTADKQAKNVQRVEEWLSQRYGNTAEEQAEAVRARYGRDRTFAVPILTTCALAGLVSWREVPPLPFELACFPQSWFKFLQLHVVSYALPALIAIGQCVYHHRPPWNPLMRSIRWLAKGRSLEVLQRIQPSNGGFLEATPLTSFVTLSLASIGHAKHPVTRRGVEFLVDSVRPDGSWPIDTNLSTWVTTLSTNALAAAGELEHLEQKDDLRNWLLDQQYKDWHPYTGAAPGAWAWTPLPGGVPDADDTPGALLALTNLLEPLPSSDSGPELTSSSQPATMYAVTAGAQWLRNLQNADGGWPTFCRGWGHLPFDRSGADLTAHALRVLGPLARACTGAEGFEYQRCVDRGFEYLAKVQRGDGSWLPLWFGNQYACDDENPTYGTARVLAAYRDVGGLAEGRFDGEVDCTLDSEHAQRGIRWLLDNQNQDGGWGAEQGVPSSVEETALALDVLLDAGADCREALDRGLTWLVERVESGGLQEPTPIGFYFAKLWYFEKLYPVIFTLSALGRVRLMGQGSG